MNKPSCLTSESLQTERLSSGRRKLLRELTIKIDNKQVFVYKGSSSDFSTIPWFGRFVVRWSKVDVAGVVHDWLYQTGKSTRKEADMIWRQVAMSGEHSANACQAWVCWAVLRLNSHRAWKSYRNQDWRSLEIKGEENG